MMSEQRRILYINHARGLGGAALRLFDLVTAVAERGYHPIVLHHAAVPQVKALFQDAGIECHDLPRMGRFPHTTGGWYSLTNPLSLMRFAKVAVNFRRDVREAEVVIRQFEPDIVHLNSLILPAYALAAHNVGVKLVWHIREASVSGHLGVRQRWLKRLVSTVPDAAIFISAAERSVLTGDQFGVVLPDYVDTARFHPDAAGAPFRQEIGLCAEDKVIVFMGGKTSIKGVRPLLVAMPLVKAAVPNAHLIISGAFAAQSTRWMYRWVRRLLPFIRRETNSQWFERLTADLRAYVHGLPWVNDVPGLLAACDVLTFPSTSPHFADPIVEAGAMGKPVVASRIDGVTELVQHEVTGLLVSPNDPQSLAAALIRVLEDDTWAADLGRQGREQAVQRFSKDVVLPQIMEIYRTL